MAKILGKKILDIPIQKKWFDMICKGIKKEDYREIKSYWTTRFYSHFDDFDLPEDNGDYKTLFDGTVRFKNGYGKNAPFVVCNVRVYEDVGNKEWGAPEPEVCCLHLVNVMAIKIDFC